MVGWTIAIVATSLALSATMSGLSAAGVFDKKMNTPTTPAERNDRARRRAMAAQSGRSSTVLTGGSLSQASSASKGGTALLGGGSTGEA